jgi:hypothetical protein
MLTATQQQMLAQAAEQNAGHIHSIAAIATLMGDVDTVQHIAQNYLHLFGTQQRQALQEALQIMLCEDCATTLH